MRIDADTLEHAGGLEQAGSGRADTDAAGQLVASARGLIPIIAEAAPQIEADAAIPPHVLAALHDARLFRMLLPRTFGGLQVAPATFFEAIEALARADASVAWCVGQACGCSMGAAFMAPEVSREIFGHPTAVMASGPPSANARAVIVEGGYRVSGTWSLASGGRHADWFGGHAAVIAADGRPLKGKDAKPVVRTMMFPRTATTLTPNWDVIGLRGTGSDDYTVTDLMVPAAYSFTRESPEDRRDASPLYELTGLNMFGIAFAATALGLARSSLEEFVALAGTKQVKGQPRLVREGAANQLQLGLAEARLRAARAFLLSALGEVGAALERTGRLTLDERVNLRLATTWAIHQGRDVVDFAYNASGVTALYRGSGIERRFRDMHTVTQHVQAGMAVFETMGQSLLGLPVTSNLL